jgi:hypothetical protein
MEITEVRAIAICLEARPKSVVQISVDDLCFSFSFAAIITNTINISIINIIGSNEASENTIETQSYRSFFFPRVSSQDTLGPTTATTMGDDDDPGDQRVQTQSVDAKSTDPGDAS